MSSLYRCLPVTWGLSGRGHTPGTETRHPCSAPTVRPMHIVIATAEPRGAYHLAPLYTAFLASGHRFTHLVPYPEPVQGAPWSEISSDLGILEHADRVVLTGGGYTPWTELIAHRAQALGIPVIVSELAYGVSENLRPRPRPSLLTAMSPAGAQVLSAYHQMPLDRIPITGTPLLDTLPAWAPVPSRVLLLSSSEMSQRDPASVLLAIAHRLRELGYEVLLRCHPREDRSVWDGFPIDASPTPAIAASTASVVIGYPGSAHPIVAALGVPLVALAPTEALRTALPPEQSRIIPNWISSLAQLEPALAAASPANASLLEFVNGPLGGSAHRLVQHWVAPLPTV